MNENGLRLIRQVYLVKLSSNDQIDFHVFNEEQIKTINLYKNFQDKQLKACSLLLRKYLDLEPVSYLINQKPISEKDVCFSTSHSYPYVAISISKDPIGIDIERKANFETKLQKICFSLKEIESRLDFTKLWTIKEALYKLLGQGSFDPLKYEILELNYNSFIWNNCKYYYQSKNIEDYVMTEVFEKESDIKITKLAYLDLLK